MLEPLVVDVLRNHVEGDFLEAGVLRGGVSICLTAMLWSAGELGTRTQWVVDSFQGLPPASYTRRFAAGFSSERAISLGLESVLGGKYTSGKLSSALTEVQRNFAKHIGEGVAGVRYLPGFFHDTLPGPVRRLALLRADSDLFASTYETLDRLYATLSVGGWFICDDWKIAQARWAILTFRAQRNITTRIYRSLLPNTVPSMRNLPVFFTQDVIAFWRKSATTG